MYRYDGFRRQGSGNHEYSAKRNVVSAACHDAAADGKNGGGDRQPERDKSEQMQKRARGAAEPA